MHRFFIAPALAIVLALTACNSFQAPDHAAAKPAAAASAGSPGAAGLSGEPVAGVCLLSRQTIFAHAKVGQAANGRMQQLAGEAQRDLDSKRGLVDAQIKALRAVATTLSPGERQRREQALGQQVRQVEQDRNLLRRELEATQLRATNQIAEAAQPLLAQIYQQHHCGLLLDRNVVLGGNTQNDLTAEVVQALDAKLQNISFDLVNLAPALPAPSASAH